MENGVLYIKPAKKSSLVYMMELGISAKVQLGSKKDGKYGLIDKTGKEVIPFIYDKIWFLADTLSGIYDQVIYYKGYVKVKKDGKWGLLDGEDNEILKPVFYDEIEVIKILSDDYVKINLDGRETIVNKNGKIIS